MQIRTTPAVSLAAALVLTVLSAVPCLAAPAGAAPPPDASKPSVQPVDVNTAGEDALVAVPGIGPALAKRIIEFRQQNGPFTRIEDLLKVRGIGEKTLQKMKPFLTVGAAARKAS